MKLPVRLHGLMRVRGFTQDDAHIFCTEEQVQSEVSKFIVMLNEVYRDFGFNEVLVKLSTRPVKRVGSDETWDKAEAGLASALKQNGLAYVCPAGRRRILRAQGRIHAERQPGPSVAVRHDTAGFQFAGASGCGVRR